jgi:hypothetical protein
MVCGGDGTSDRGLLLIIGKTFTSKVGTSALRDLQDKRGLDISTRSSLYSATIIDVCKQQTNLAASRQAFAVEEDVTF